MPSIDVRLEEQSPDLRSRELAFKLIVTNNGASAIDILAVSPRIPEGASLLETKDTSFLATKARHAKLCAELNALSREVLLVSDQQLWERMIELRKRTFEEVLGQFGGWLGIFRLYYYSMRGRLMRDAKKARDAEGALFVTVESSIEAKRILAEMIEGSGLEQTLKKSFAFKADRLAELEEEMGGGEQVEAASIATVEPDSFFATTYILRFPRTWLNPSKFSISVEVAFRDTSRTGRHNAAATTSVAISPSPFALSIITMISAVMGLVLKHAIPQSSSPYQPSFNWTMLLSTESIASMILALVFFNIFEFTNLLPKIRSSLGWRSALAIGVLCGVASDRIYAALKALLGG